MIAHQRLPSRPQVQNVTKQINPLHPETGVGRESPQSGLDWRSRLQIFAAEIHDVGLRHSSALGRDDCEHMLALVALSRERERDGRQKLRALNPKRFASGVWDLARHYVMEFTNSHAVLHEGYEALPGGYKLKASEHVWNNTPDEDDWRISHSQGHHPHTNRVGKDDDLGYLLFRVSDLQPFRWYHPFQTLFLLFMPFVESVHFPLYIASARARIEGRSVWTRDTFGSAARKILRHWRINYVEEPIRARWAALQVILGNFVARHVANVMIVSMLSCEHLNGRVLDVEPDDPPLDRDEFYLQQVLTSASFTVTDHFEAVHSLGVSLHIEHHLYPRMPIGRLPMIRDEIRPICEKYEVPYDCEPWYRALWAATVTVVRHSVPWAKPSAARLERRRFWREWRDEHRARRRRQAAVAPVEEYQLQLARRGQRLPVRSDEPLLTSLERAGLSVPTLCRRGACGTCEMPLLDGEILQYGAKGRQPVVRLCSAFPRSDLCIDM